MCYRLLLSIIIFTAFIGACSNKKTEAQNTVVSASKEVEELAGLSNLGTASPSSEIDIVDARDMVKKYLQSKRYIAHSVGGGKLREDTRAVVFDSGFVRRLYEAMQCEKATGIRVYFGVYDKPKYKEQQLYKTVIITTTYYDTVFNRSGQPVVIQKDNLTNSCRQKDIFWKYSMKTIDNKGGLCPPPEDSCAYYGALLLPPGN